MNKLTEDQKLYLYAGLVETLIESGAENYLSLTFSRDDDEDSYEILIRRTSGLTDAQKNLELEARIAELEKENDELNSTSDELYSLVFNHIDLTIEFPDQVDHTDIKQLLEVHNLEQHSLAVNKFANKFCGDATTNYQVQLTIDAHCWCEMLDSKALKEQVK